MTQQQLLQKARNVIIGMTDAQRQCLKTAAIAKGRTAAQVSKAGTMRLALWVVSNTNRIWVSTHCRTNTACNSKDKRKTFLTISIRIT